MEQGSLSCCGYSYPRSKSFPGSWSNISLGWQRGAPTEPVHPCRPAPTKQGAAGVCSSIQPPAIGLIVHKSLLCPDEGRHWWEEVSWQPLGLCMALPAFLSPANMALQKDQGCQTDFTPTPGLCVADRKDRSQPHIAAPVSMQLRHAAERSKLCMHAASSAFTQQESA